MRSTAHKSTGVTRALRTRVPPVAVAALALLSGCAVFDVPVPPLFDDEPEFESPAQLIPVWADTVLHQPGKPAQRGCGGRFMFYKSQEKEAIQVDGSVVVYAWNDTDTSHQRQPDRKYVFRADELQEHYSKSKVGHSYSFWIPWDEAGGNRTELTVVARFVGRNGADVTSSPAKVILQGPVPLPERPVPLRDDEDLKLHSDPLHPIQQASHTSESKPRTSNEKVRSRYRTSLRSSEIPLTEGFLTRNQASAALSADDLFVESNNAHPAQRTPSLNDPDTSRPGEQHDSPMATRQTSAKREAHLLQSRFQARRARVARRSSSPLPTELSPESSQSVDSMNE